MRANYVSLIHELTTKLPKQSLPLRTEVRMQAGMMLIFERTEHYFEHERIVYVGYSGQMSKRWRQVLYGKTQSNIRRYLQMICEDEQTIDTYLHEQSRILLLACPNEMVAKTYAQHVTLLLQSDQQFQPEATWFGRQVQLPPLAETKLWQNFAPQSLELNTNHIEAFIELLTMMLAQLDDDELPSGTVSTKQAAEQGTATPPSRLRLRQEWVRNPYVRAYTLAQAQGRCQLCEQPAPFRLADGTPFLEVHHIVPLEDGGPDTIANCVALCPNCHREVHYAPKQEYQYLKIAENITKE